MYAAREQTNMPKANETSPFALLVDAAAASAPKAADQKNANPSGADSQNDNQPESDAIDQTVAPLAQNSGAQPQIASGGGQPSAQPANGNRQDEDIQALADQDAAPPVPQTIEPAIPPALPPAASQVTQAANDDTTSTSETISGEDAVALWPQSARPAPQAAPAKPIKADKSVKKDGTEPGAQPDPAAMLAAGTPSPDQQSTIPPAAMVPPPPAPAPQVQAQADQPTIQPGAQPAAAPVPVLPQDPVLPPGPVGPQPAAQRPAGQQTTQQATDQVTGQTSDQTAGQATPPAPATPAQAVPPVSPPDAVPSAQNRTAAADKAAQAADPLKPQPPAPQDGAKTEATKSAKTAGKTPADSDPAIVKSADTPAADQVRQPEAPKPAVSQADAPAPKVAVDTITPPAAQPAAPQIQSPAITQHVQVTAQPHEAKPNLPALAVEIAAKSQGGVKQFDIRLDPPELGRVEVRLSIDATGKASAHLSADQPQTLTLLQKDAHVLSRALRDAGLDVSQDGLNFSLRQQANHDSGAGAHNQAGHRSGRGFALSASTSLEASATSAAYSSPANGHLDIRV
jgi:hypothetical protein